MRKYFILFTIILLSTNTVYAKQLRDSIFIKKDSLNMQAISIANTAYQAEFPNIIHPSPQAQLYMRYGEVPVNLSTGIPEISIPIYQIDINGFKLPINISYHAGGNKVEDAVSTVGLGWVLNAGGLITQTIYGRPDEWNEVKFQSAHEAYKKLNESIASQRLDFTWYALLNRPHEIHAKTISDRYFFSFNGNTGVFRKDIKTGELKVLNHSSIRIERISDEELKITDSDGNIWYFKRFESLTAFDNNGIPPSYEFYVEKIKLIQTGDIITFTYSLGENTSKERDIPQVKLNYLEPTWVFSPSIHDLWDVYINVNTHNETYFVKNSRNTYKPVLLKKIEWRNSKIDFLYKKERLDIGIKERLDKILVTAGDSIATSAQFSNSYLGNQWNNYRMLLDGISINAEKHKFIYNKDIILPPKRDNANNTKCNIDFWGYYNGADSPEWCPFKFVSVNAITVDKKYLPIREVDTCYTQAGILKEIVYPTGGRTVFEYEQNRGEKVYRALKDIEPKIDYFGGVRIKGISNYDKNKLLNAKSYAYEGGPAVTLTPFHYYEEKIFQMMPSEEEFPSRSMNSLNCANKPYPSSLYSDDCIMYEHYYRRISSSELLPITNQSGPSVCYDKVTEYVEGGNNGKIEYKYMIGQGVSPYNDLGQTNHLLQSKKTFGYSNGAYFPLQELINEYETVNHADFITGVKIEDNAKIFLYDVEFNRYANYYQALIYNFYYSNFKFTDIRASFSFFPILKKSITKDFQQEEIITTTIDYIYDNEFRVISPIETRISNSTGKVYVEKITHPFNYPTIPIYKNMVTKNMISPYIQKAQYIISDLNAPLHIIQNDYIAFDNKIVIGSTSFASRSNLLEKRIQYKEFDNYGNPIHITKDDTNDVIYLWSYAGQYPIAEIKNATYSDVNSALSTVGLTSIDALSANSSPDKVKLDKLRTLPILSNAMITTYKYQPLVGMLESTDPSGLTTYYQYDSFGRLMHTKDVNGKTIQTYDYHYHNQ